MFVLFVRHHLRSLVMACLLLVVWGGASTTPPIHADPNACASLLAFPKPPPVPLGFPKPPPVPLGGIGGQVLEGTQGAPDEIVSLYRCNGAGATLVGQTVSGADGAFAFASPSSILPDDHDYYVEVPGITTQGAYAVPGMTQVDLQAR